MINRCVDLIDSPKWETKWDQEFQSRRLLGSVVEDNQGLWARYKKQRKWQRRDEESRAYQCWIPICLPSISLPDRRRGWVSRDEYRVGWTFSRTLSRLCDRYISKKWEFDRHFTSPIALYHSSKVQDVTEVTTTRWKVKCSPMLDTRQPSMHLPSRREKRLG